MDEGAAPNQRGLRVTSKVMKNLGYGGYVLFGSGAHPMVAEILSVHSSKYRQKDLGMGGVHGGIFIFRDVFARIYIPFAYGTVKLDPFTLTDLTKNQLAWLAIRPADYQGFWISFRTPWIFLGHLAAINVHPTPHLSSSGLRPSNSRLSPLP
ncbi:hypothetical protein IVA95_03890 [Bradyrhizobium sp. 157]|uniref:hypothetical protein n=1 Tax=Bradyrhizobium sp. 157 TaxID=2782631 RepID=UPI001FF9EF49|nr:hypothetical protein [Bradyrhizobium sp. 157]MCK1636756.1 hypothetical protein [Bradyrhizobium sp. 157]